MTVPPPSPIKPTAEKLLAQDEFWNLPEDKQQEFLHTDPTYAALPAEIKTSVYTSAKTKRGLGAGATTDLSGGKSASISAPSAYDKEHHVNIAGLEGDVSGRSLTGAIPAVLGGIGAFAGPAGMILGGAGGSLIQSAVDQLATGQHRAPGPIEKATGISDLPPTARSIASAGLEGAEQYGLGKLGEIFGPLIKRLAPKVPVGELAKQAEEYGLPLSQSFVQRAASKTLSGSAVASRGRERGLTKAAEDAAAQGKILGISDLPPSADATEIRAYATAATKSAADADKMALDAVKAAAKLDAQTVNEANLAKHAADVAKAKEVAAAANIEAAAKYKAATELAAVQGQANKEVALNSAQTSDASDITNLLTQLSEKGTPKEAGQGIKTVIGGSKETRTRGTSQIGAKEGSRLYKEAQAANADQLVDLGPHIDELKQLHASGAFNEAPALKKYISKYISTDLDPEAIATEMYGDIGLNKLRASNPQRYEEVIAQIKNDYAGVAGKSTVPFSEALADLQQLRTGIKPGELSSPKARGLLKHITGGLSQAIDDSIAGKSSAVLQGSPEAKAAWDSSEKYWQQYSGTFKRGMVPRMFRALEQSPDTVLDHLNKPSKIEALREATVGYAERFGTDAEKAQAKSAFQSVQSAYVRNKLLAGGADSLNANIAKAGTSLDTMFADNPEFVEAIRNVGKATEATKAIAKGKPFVPEIPKTTPVEPNLPPKPPTYLPADVAIPPSPERQAAISRLTDLAAIVGKTPRAPGVNYKVSGTIGSLAYAVSKIGVGTPLAITATAAEEGLSALITAAAYDPIAARGLNGLFGKLATTGKVGTIALGELATAIHQVTLEKTKPPAPIKKTQ